MTQNKRVLLCGQSLFISSVRACLEIEPGLVLQQVDPQSEHIWGQVLAWQPEAEWISLCLTQPALAAVIASCTS